MEGSLGVSGEDLLGLFATGKETDDGSLVAQDIDLVFLLDLNGEVGGEDTIEFTKEG